MGVVCASDKTALNSGEVGITGMAFQEKNETKIT